MYYKAAPEHRSFFSRHGTIDFEELLTPEEIDCLKQAQSHAQHAKDLWRQSPEACKILLSKKCAQIAAELTGLKFLRIGFDLQLKAGTLVATTSTLQNLASIQSIVCGLMLDLSSGKGTFIAPEFILAPHMRQEKLVIAYGSEKMVYIHNPTDPYTHELKKDGYVFGDLISTSTHPLVYF